ncbi:MAG: LytR/AlgR family response regulator transcription factor [Halobacteriaceae archaeon]
MPTSENGTPDEGASRPPADESHPAVVLVVDDDEDFRETLRLWAVADGRWQVIEAPDGEAALRKLDESVDVVVLDRQMPNLSGPETLARLDDLSFEAPVVVVSAYEPDEYLNEDAVAAYLVKPVDRREFFDALEATAR